MINEINRILVPYKSSIVECMDKWDQDNTNDDQKKFYEALELTSPHHHHTGNLVSISFDFEVFSIRVLPYETEDAFDVQVYDIKDFDWWHINGTKLVEGLIPEIEKMTRRKYIPDTF